jgi:hypothetical protein
VYGSDAATADNLRTFSGGLLKVSDTGNLLPTIGSKLTAGERRATENPALASILQSSVSAENFSDYFSFSNYGQTLITKNQTDMNLKITKKLLAFIGIQKRYSYILI